MTSQNNSIQESVVVAFPGQLRRGMPNHAYLLDNEFLGTFAFPGYSLWVYPGKLMTLPPVLVDLDGVVLVDLVRMPKEKLRLLHSLGFIDQTHLRSVQYGSFGEVLVPVESKAPAGFIRAITGDFVRWNKSIPQP